MLNRLRFVSLLMLVMFVLPLAAGAVVEEKTKTEYPDEITLGEGEQTITLKATGVALREKTFMKVDAYLIVGYVDASATLSDDKAEAFIELVAPKRIQMDLTRGFSADKLKNSFSESIEKNFEDLSAFQADMDLFLAYFTADAQEGDKLIFDFCPAKGLSTELNGETLGTIENVEFMKALWSVWFGKEPVNKGMKEKLLANIQ